MLLHGEKRVTLYGIIMRMGRRFYKKWKKEEDDGSDGNISVRIFLMQGFMRQTDRKDCLPFFRSGSRTESVFMQG